MIKHVIVENSEIRIDSVDIEVAKKLLEETGDSYFSIDGNNLIFKPYIVGEIRVGNSYILINPRHEAYGISHIFEMATFIDNGSLNSSSAANNYEFGDYGVAAIYMDFIGVIGKLVNYGPTGEFQTQHSFSHSIYGELDFQKYVKQSIPMTGIPNIFQSYEINTIQNRLIKAAIGKILTQVGNIYRKDLLYALEFFKYVDNIVMHESSLDKKLFEYHGSNPHYDLALEYAYAILKNLKIKYNGGDIEYYSFLYNSNNLFEAYILKILKNERSFLASKWDTVKEFAYIKTNTENSKKSFSPDVLINYNDDMKSALAVFDVKNKFYNPDTKQLSDSVANGDIYQLLFYFARLQTSTGGLIYPAKKRYEPIRMILNDYKQEIFFLSINMSDSLKNRHETFISDIISLIR